MSARSVPSARRSAARTLLALVVIALVAIGPGRPAAADDVPTIEIRGRSVPLDGRALPDDLTTEERAEVFAAASRALRPPRPAAWAPTEGPDWVPIVGLAEVWCTQSNPGWGGCAGHHDRPAIDLGVPVGTVVVAAGPGIVVTAATDGGGRGTYVDLAHPDGSSSHYYHLSALAVRPGQRVERGDHLGRSGSTGSSTAPHLHYEEHGPDGQPRPIGPMSAQVRGRTVSFPDSTSGTDWPQVAYGTLVASEGYRAPVEGDLNGDGRRERASGVLLLAAGAVGVSASPVA